MGLAPYGDPERYIDEFRQIVRTTEDGGYAHRPVLLHLPLPRPAALVQPEVPRDVRPAAPPGGRVDAALQGRRRRLAAAAPRRSACTWRAGSAGRPG